MRCTIRAAFLVAVTAGLGSVPSAGTQVAPVFAALEGEWIGEGALMGRDAEFTMRWDVMRELATLSFTNAFKGADGTLTRVLGASAVYRTTTADPVAVWFDTRGVRVEIRWESTDSALVSTWTAPSEQGRTSYRVLGADRVEVTDEVRRDGTLEVFGTAQYRRVRDD